MSDDSNSNELPELKLSKIVVKLYESIKRKIILDKDRKDNDM